MFGPSEETSAESYPADSLTSPEIVAADRDTVQVTISQLAELITKLTGGKRLAPVTRPKPPQSFTELGAFSVTILPANRFRWALIYNQSSGSNIGLFFGDVSSVTGGGINLSVSGKLTFEEIGDAMLQPIQASSTGGAVFGFQEFETAFPLDGPWPSNLGA